MEAKSRKGGKRKGAGRKRNNPPTIPQTIYLTEEEIRLVLLWGKGSISSGLRWLIAEASKVIVKPDPPHSNL